VYPASDWCFGTAGDPAGFVTMVNAHAVKGLNTFLEIARRMPGQRFLLQESWKLDDAALAALKERLAPLPNVTFQHRVPDMRQVYARTRLLLVPSVWEEGFGMVAVEAQSCGIPVVASARGGLPESVGDGGLLIDDYRNVDAWVAAIEGMLGDEAAYQRWSARALAHARSGAFAPRQLARRFLDVCSAAPPQHAGAYARGLRAIKDGLGRVPMIGRMLHGASK
jgi:glycosyltransferase involved in cell wall biosynthesis